MSSTTTSDPADYYGIHTGAWINWSDGRILGGTITLTRRDGGFLISLIALFVTWTGTAFWRFACFLFHHYYCSEAPRDGVYHQRQAILRNSANGVSGLWSLGLLAWAWRGKTGYTHRRMVPVLTFTITCLCCFAVAGIFSSRIATSTGSQVLVSSPTCGRLDSALETNATLYSTVYAPYNRKQGVDSVNYAQNCYNNVSSVEACKRYIRPQLPWSTNRNASCPFGGGICRDQFGNLELDSGYIDSNDHLGHNDPPEMRFKYRHLLKCAPLITEGYRQQYTYTAEGRDSQYMRYYYGKGIVSDHTYEYPMPSVREFHDQNFTGAYQDYTLATMPAVFLNHSIREVVSMFDPIPELRQIEGDITLYFLSPNFVMFSGKTDDPWYSAHTDFMEVYMTGLDGRMTTYRADEPASVLACVSQYQICNPNQPANSQCTALGSIEDREQGFKSLHFNDRQTKVIEWFGSLLAFSVYNLIGDLGSSVLTSRYSVSGGLQAPLPNNQWQLEVENWFTIWLASLQQLFVSYATGPSDPEVMRWVRTPKDETERNICRNQKIVTTAYTNFNTLGLCLTFVVGTLIIVVSYTIEPVVSCIQKRRTLDTYSRLEWCANETLQLQRMAHEELGVGTWRNGAEAIPLTDGGERLATLDVTNPDHPRLRAPPVPFDALLARGKEGKAAPSSGDAGSGTVSSEKLDPANHVGEVADDCPGNHAKWPLISDGVPSVEELEAVERQSGNSSVQSGLT